MKTATSRYILLQHAPLLTGIHFSVELETMRKMTSCRLVILWTLMTTEVKNKKLHNWGKNKLFYIMNVPRSNGNFNIMVNERFPFRPPNWFFTVDSCFLSSEPNILVKLVLPQSNYRLWNYEHFIFAKWVESWRHNGGVKLWHRRSHINANKLGVQRNVFAFLKIQTRSLKTLKFFTVGQLFSDLDRAVDI